MANRKQKRFGKKKAKYAVQALHTERNKHSSAKRRERRLEYWLSKGVKKNGKPVMTVEQRQERREKKAAERMLHSKPRYQPRKRGYRPPKPRRWIGED